MMQLDWMLVKTFVLARDGGVVGLKWYSSALVLYANVFAFMLVTLSEIITTLRDAQVENAD